jgi:hypothetical protein
MTGTKGISKKYAKRSLDKANELRQYSPEALNEFTLKAEELLDLFSCYLENNMKTPAKGRGSRMTKEHIELNFGKFYLMMRKAMDGEKNE